MTRPRPPENTAGDNTLTDGLATTTSDRAPEQDVQRPALLAVSVLYHPDVGRIGERLLVPWRLGERVALDRRGPNFVDPDGRARGPLADRGVSRRALQLTCTSRGLRVESDGELPYRLAGAPLAAVGEIPFERLGKGLLLECSRRVILWIDTWKEAPSGEVHAELWGISQAVEILRARITSLGPHDLPVAIAGESGTGKELVARALHACSPRSKRPWVPVNVGALNLSTAAADLFGHARGAFTGADQARPGYFRRAHGGTLFLDEIGSLPDPVQPMLLRALESGEIQPVGEAPSRVDVRLLTATDADLDQLSDAGRFFRPLLYRIRTTRLVLPPLRARPADIPLLFMRFASRQLESLGALDRLEAGESPWIGRRIVDALLQHRWPGNVRELRNVAVQMVIESIESPRARLPEHFSAERGGRLSDPIAALRDITAPPAVEGRDWAVPPDALVEALRRHRWRVRPVADELGVARNTVYAMMGRLGIRRPGDLTRDDIFEALAAVGRPDAAAIAARLEVSERGLKLRMRALGVVLDG